MAPDQKKKVDLEHAHLVMERKDRSNFHGWPVQAKSKDRMLFLPRLDRIVTDPCSKCKGDGRAHQPMKVKFSVNPGVMDGTRLRMRGQGESSSTLNGESGDLYIEIDVEPHPWFERDGS